MSSSSTCGLKCIPSTLLRFSLLAEFKLEPKLKARVYLLRVGCGSCVGFICSLFIGSFIGDGGERDLSLELFELEYFLIALILK